MELGAPRAWMPWILNFILVERDMRFIFDLGLISILSSSFNLVGTKYRNKIWQNNSASK